jgi:hypothetical protein
MVPPGASARSGHGTPKIYCDSQWLSDSITEAVAGLPVVLEEARRAAAFPPAVPPPQANRQPQCFPRRGERERARTSPGHTPTHLAPAHKKGGAAVVAAVPVRAKAAATHRPPLALRFICCPFTQHWLCPQSFLAFRCCILNCCFLTPLLCRV